MTASVALDHAGFAVRNLAALLSTMQRIGFSVTKPVPLLGTDAATGQSIPLGQDSAHMVFRRGYVELTGVPDPAAGNHLEPFLARYEGLHILALHADEPGEVRARLEAAGVPVTPLATATRAIEYGERHGDARFSWFMLQPGAFDAGLLCVMRGHTPELVYQPAVQVHANRALGLSALTLLTREPGRALEILELIAGVRAEPTADAKAGSWRLALRDGELRVLSALDASPPYTNTSAGHSPCLCGLTFEVERPERLETMLIRQGIACTRQRRSVLVGVPAGGGAVLEFAPMRGAPD